jgi:hypothetical protein
MSGRLTRRTGGCYPKSMRVVALLLFALLAAPVAAPIATAAAAPADHSCCPEPTRNATAPCQYLAPLGCCEQTLAPAGAPATPQPTQLYVALPPGGEPLASALAPRARAPRPEHGPPQEPFLRAIVLQL